MKPAPLPFNEQHRLEVLRSYGILDTEHEAEFDEIVQLASQICETPVSLISLIDEHRQWFKAKVGFDQNETDRELAFCAHAINQNEIMIVQDATKDIRFLDNPLVTNHPDIRFYAGMPLITPDGYNLGTLCVIDNRPKTLTDQQIFSLRILAKQVIKQFELKLKVKELEKQKESLQKLNQTNSRLLSIIGHDLRSPLSMLTGLVQLSGDEELSKEDFQTLIRQMETNLFAANELLANLFQWAVQQFEGNKLKRVKIQLTKLIEEELARNTSLFEKKQNKIINEVDKNCELMADTNAMSFVLRNLILNSNKFTERGEIKISSKKVDNEIQVSVSDTGVGMNPEYLDKLFDGFLKTTSRGTQGESGSGLGLPVCKEFIEKHGGKIWVESEPGKGTTFHFSIPQDVD